MQCNCTEGLYFSAFIVLVRHMHVPPCSFTIYSFIHTFLLPGLLKDHSLSIHMHIQPNLLSRGGGVGQGLNVTLH